MQHLKNLSYELLLLRDQCILLSFDVVLLHRPGSDERHGNFPLLIKGENSRAIDLESINTICVS